MEGLAQVSETTFFGLTSHSMTKKGKRKPEREQLILFSMNSSKISAEKSFSLRGAAGTLSSLDVTGFSDLSRPESLIVEDETALIFLQDFQEESEQEVIVRLQR